jgi:hypothetical protein
VLIATAGVVVLLAGTFGVLEYPNHRPAHTAAARDLPKSGLATPPPGARPLATAGARTLSVGQPTGSGGAGGAGTATAGAVDEPTPLGQWPLNGSAVDSVGSQDGIATKVSFFGDAAVLTGANDSFIATPETVLKTGPGASFTVSAWVDLTSMPTSASFASTAVSQDAGINSAFYLQYFGGETNRWAFTRMDTDTVISKSGRAESTSVPALGTWTHLVGVYQASTGTLYLYVNGDLQGTATDKTPFASSGGLVIGRARYNSTGSDGFGGRIKEVEVFGSALGAAAVAALD